MKREIYSIINEGLIPSATADKLNELFVNNMVQIIEHLQRNKQQIDFELNNILRNLKSSLNPS